MGSAAVAGLDDVGRILRDSGSDGLRYRGVLT